MSHRTLRSYSKSQQAFTRSEQYLVGGVNSPVRAYKSVGGTPIFAQAGKGAYLSDIDGNRYIDYVGSYGPLILGHQADPIVQAIETALSIGWSFGMPTELEMNLAQKVNSILPSIEKIRFVNSGTEAVMGALRVARGFTGRHKVMKVEGGYHGHHDSLLVSAGSGATTLGTPSSQGVSQSMVQDTLLVPYNDIDTTISICEQYSDQIAAFIIEPIAGNMGCVLPDTGYLKAVRELCDKYQILLIFDEVMTGFRVGLQGAQGLYEVKPDLTTLGKVLGGGIPCGAYGGRDDVMSLVSPSGPVYQAGTLSGNPLAMSAGLAMLNELDNSTYQKLDQMGQRLEDGIKHIALSKGVPIYINRCGSMMTLFFNDGSPITNYTQACKCDTQRYAAFFHNMLQNGILLPPSQYECWFLSLSHQDHEIEQTLKAIELSL